MTDPFAYWTPDQIAAATSGPKDAILETWPRLFTALEQHGVGDRLVSIAALATVAVEASSFRPVREAYWLSGAARNSYLTRMYEGRADLGNSETGDGVRYAGRGLIQITGRANYRTYGATIGVDLEADPDAALDPGVACRIFAAYFTRHYIRWLPQPSPLMNCVDLARSEEWRGVRVAVNGGENGLDLFLHVVANLEGAAMPVTYDKQYPEMGQNDPWSCGPTALRWALHALGRRPAEQWIEDTMIAEGVASKADGILDATGAGIAAFVRRQYGEFGIEANHEPIISYDWAVAEGGHAYPFLIGGRAWGHWAAVRDYDAANDRLLLMNPAEGWMNVGQAMSRQQFQALGPFSAVRVWHPDLLTPPVIDPDPPIIVPPVDTRMARARELLVQALAVLDEPAPA